LWSFALLIREILANTPHFDESKVTLEHIASGVVKPTLPSSCPFNAKIKKLLNECWDFTPSNRPTSEALKLAFDEYLKR
jgi:hypothetical protein